MLPPRRFVPPRIVLPGEVASAEQLMAIAHGLEREAARRYRELATRMRQQGDDALAKLFAVLATIEDKHAGDVGARAVGLLGHAPDPKAVEWDLPENFDEEDARGAGLSPYRALAIAVRNEERAFAFYSYIAAYGTPELQRTAEHLAKDELAHASLLRHERRKAWRAQAVLVAPPDPPPETMEMLLAEAVAMERAAAAAHRALAAHLRATRSREAGGLFAAAADDEDDLARTLAARLPPGAAPPERISCAGSIRDGLKLLEFAFERYAQIAERTTVEPVLLEAQTLTERALRRLAHVHGALGCGPSRLF
jgi:rubrerythrin